MRPGSNTRKAIEIVNRELRESDTEFEFIDLADLTLLHPGGTGESSDMEAVREMVRNSRGLILSTPEYHGSFSAALKLFIENLDFPSVLKGKPVALLGVAAGVIGAIKSLEHLRSVCSHVGCLVLPEPVSIAGVRNVFDDAGNCLDEKLEARVRGLASKLTDFAVEK